MGQTIKKPDSQLRQKIVQPDLSLYVLLKVDNGTNQMKKQTQLPLDQTNKFWCQRLGET
jgi:hypothetical protein